jgi:DASH complex subunit DAD2
MYRPTSNLPTHLRQSSLSTSNSQTSALQQRINEKRAELENLKQLRELSAGLAGQMEQLEEKLSTLSDGTQGAPSYRPYHYTSTDSCSHCDRSVQLAYRSQSNSHGFWYVLLSTTPVLCLADLDAAHIAKPQQDTGSESEANLLLPQTLVRIPMQHVDQSELPQSDNAEDSTVK